jgi:hypothetical protein
MANVALRLSPLFGVRQDDQGQGITLSVVWQKPFGLRDYTLAVGGRVERTGSNIPFFEVHGHSVFMSLNYAFSK